MDHALDVREYLDSMKVLRFFQSQRYFYRFQYRFSGLVVATALFVSLLSPLITHQQALAQASAYCTFPAEAIAQKELFLQATLQGNLEAYNSYKTTLNHHAEWLRQCRSQSWLKQQAIWLRLYPCDARPGGIDALLDRIVNRGYNQVYVEVFYNGQILLPVADNRTPWPSTLRQPGYENRDLLAEMIAKGHERGLKVYAWMFTMNFGYTYSQRPEGQQVLARNGAGHTSLSLHHASRPDDRIGGIYEEAFVDPYHPKAKQDYYYMVEAVLRRRPDGVLFDYIRYPRGPGAASIAHRVQDLWLYGEASQQALLQRALNPSGQDLIRRYISQGYVTIADIESVLSLYPQDGEPLWQGRVPSLSLAELTPAEVHPYLQAELWHLSVAHAIQGVLDFLSLAIYPVQRQGMMAGAVFFPEGNQAVGRGYDSRLQPWDRFPDSIEWHPMAYATCGNTACVVEQVQQVMAQAPPGTQVKPVLAGVWGQTVNHHPPLEAQMQSIHQRQPKINAISHFAYSWQEPASDRDRKFCQL